MPVNKVNIYTCPDCKAEMVTVDVDDGVTPFMLACRSTPGCKGRAQSCFYRPRNDHPPPAWEWYAPGAEERRKSSPGMREHAEKGGLFIRARG